MEPNKASNFSVNEIVRPRDLPRYTGLSRTTIWRLEKENKFVTKIFLTQHCIGYKRIDIERWLEERMKSSLVATEVSP